jgi:hypothetical protein
VWSGTQIILTRSNNNYKNNKNNRGIASVGGRKMTAQPSYFLTNRKLRPQAGGREKRGSVWHNV